MKKILLLLGLVLACMPLAAQYAYITNSLTNRVDVLDIATQQTVGSIPIAGGPTGITVLPATGRVYVASLGNNTVTAIEGLRAVATISVGSGPHGLALSPDGSRLYVTHSYSNSVSVINTAANTVETTITVGNNPFGVAVNPVSSQAYVTVLRASNVAVINGSSLSVTGGYPTQDLPFGLAVSPDGSWLFVVNTNGNSISAIRTATGATTIIPVGTGPNAVAFNTDGSRAYVTNGQSNTVSVINVSMLAVTATLPVGEMPFGIDLTPNGLTMVVANANSDFISVINLEGNTTSSVYVGMGAKSFGRFVVTTPAPLVGPLPVTLAHWQARPDGPVNRLQWQTTAERHSAFFVVERSPDARHFEAIGTVAAQGTTSGRTDYTWADGQLSAAATHYYRLRQVDTDGAYQYSRVLSVGRGLQAPMQAYPTPARNTLSVQVAAPARLHLTNAAGLPVASWQCSARGEVHFDVSRLQPGIYFLQNETTRQTIRWVKE